MTTARTRAIIEVAYSERTSLTLYHLFVHGTRAVALIELDGVEMAAETWEVREDTGVAITRYEWDVAVLARLAYWVAPPPPRPRHLMPGAPERSAA